VNSAEATLSFFRAWGDLSADEGSEVREPAPAAPRHRPDEVSGCYSFGELLSSRARPASPARRHPETEGAVWGKENPYERQVC